MNKSWMILVTEKNASPCDSSQTDFATSTQFLSQDCFTINTMLPQEECQEDGACDHTGGWRTLVWSHSHHDVSGGEEEKCSLFVFQPGQ